jgi:hypothetical protein
LTLESPAHQHAAMSRAEKSTSSTRAASKRNNPKPTRKASRKARSSAAGSTDSSSLAAAAWDPDRPECLNTYGVLRGLRQLSTPIDDAGEVRMKELAFWNKAASDSMRRLIAAGLAAKLDTTFIKVFFAAYEESKDFHSAIQELQDTLASADTTLTDLAANVNAIYHFRSEV